MPEERRPVSFHFKNHHPIFHVRDGLSFRRRPTGEVRIDWKGSWLYLTEHEWASVVAFLARDGENAETFKAALDFYNGEPASKLKEQEERCERLEEAARKAEDRKEFCEQWYAERIRRLTDLLKEHDLWTEGACILAIGTASVKADGSYEYEPPTYAQQLNAAKWLADKAMDDYRKLQSRLGALAADFDRREQEAKAEAADAPSERVHHREEGISLAFGAAAGDLRTALQHSPEDEGATDGAN